MHSASIMTIEERSAGLIELNAIQQLKQLLLAGSLITSIFSKRKLQSWRAFTCGWRRIYDDH